MIPQQTGDIVLSAELNSLVEAMAKNKHEVWAESRFSQGWTYGPEYNDAQNINIKSTYYGFWKIVFRLV